MDCPRISYYNIKQLNIPDTNLASTVEVNCNISCSLGSVSVCVMHWPRVLWGFFVQMCPRSVLGSRYFLVTLSCTDQTRQMGPGECWLKPGGAQTQRRQWRHQFCVPETFNVAHLSMLHVQSKGNQKIHFVNFIASTEVRSPIFQSNCFHQEQRLLPGRLSCAGGHCCYSGVPWQAREWAELNLIKFKKGKCQVSLGIPPGLL